MRINILVGIIVSSSFFTLMHLGNNAINLISIVNLFLFWVFAALIIIKSKNIWLISGFHALWNAFQGDIFTFPISGLNVGSGFIQVETIGPSFLSGGEFGVEGSIISIIVQTILVIWLIYDIFYKNNFNIFARFEIDKKGDNYSEYIYQK